MIFQLPPPPPAHATVLAEATLRSDCARGSRDCFPKDRVGAAASVQTVLAPQSALTALAHLLPAQAEL